MIRMVLLTGALWLQIATALVSNDERASAQRTTSAPQVFTIKPGPGVQHEVQGILIQAAPGDTLQLVEGTYEFEQDLIVTTDNITIRGKGPSKTILSFKKQHLGSKGLEATGNNFVIEDLAVEDAKGNAIKVLGAHGVTFRRVRAEWTSGPKSTNGAYGLYPVQCENVLIESCASIGASDAGIYVGQSKNIVVRNCRAEQNVAGIEIENSINADVYENSAINNTGGILVFDLPGLQMPNGHTVRVFRNHVRSNNHPNFAPPGNIVGTVPPGTGVMVMATDNVEVFDNEIHDHDTSNVALISFLLTGIKFDPRRYDPISQSVSVHDNQITGGGKQPGGRLGELLKPALGAQFPDILYDGIIDENKLIEGKMPAELGLRIENNGGATFANIHLSDVTPEKIRAGKVNINRDLAPYSGRFAPLPAVELEPHAPPIATIDPTAHVYRDAPKHLSDYGLFQGNGATQEPAQTMVPYDLTTSLFSDYTTKHRFFRLPAGTSIGYRERDVFEFPVGTVIAKTFATPPDHGNPPAKERLLETRIIEHKESGWYGYSYVWNEAQTDATLALGGSTIPVRWTHSDGKPRSNDYIVPHANQCKSCHVTGQSFEPIGPKARYLNREFAYAHGPENQLAYLSRSALLSGAATSDKAPRSPAFDDPHSGTVETRARAWLDINCAHCHSPSGPARTSGLDLRLHQVEPAKIGVWKPPIAAGRGSGGRKYDIVPGKPDESILIYRLASTEPGVMMPELPRRLIPDEALELIREWILQMPDPKGTAESK